MPPLDEQFGAACRQAEWAGWDVGDERTVDVTVRMLGLVGRWPEDDLLRLVDAFGAVGSGLPDDVQPLLRDMARGRQQHPEQH